MGKHGVYQIRIMGGGGGLTWLYGPESDWHVSQLEINEDEVESEVQKTSLVQIANIETSEFRIGDYFPSYTKLVCFLAWMYRFIKNREKIIQERKVKEKAREFPYLSYLTENTRKKLCLIFKEIKAAETKLLKHLQICMYADNAKARLSSFKTLKNKDGLYIGKTKIFNRDDDLRFFCPILLDGKQGAVRLLVREAHEKLGHAGAFWPPRSCDLTPLDFFLWGHIKSLVYANKPATSDDFNAKLPTFRSKCVPEWCKIGFKKSTAVNGLVVVI